MNRPARLGAAACAFAVTALGATGAMAIGCRTPNSSAATDSSSRASATSRAASSGSAQPAGAAAGPSGKRVPPPDVPPVDVGDLRIETVPWGKDRGLGQNGGYIAAHDRTSGRELWTLKVYDVVYQPRMEEDVQDVFIERMTKVGDNQLEITDESGRHYVVDVKRRTVTRR